MLWQILTKKQAEEPLDFLKIQTKKAWVKSTEKPKSSVTLPLSATFKTSEKIKSWIQSNKHLVSYIIMYWIRNKRRNNSSAQL